MDGEEVPTVWPLSIYWEEVLDHLHTEYQQLQQERLKEALSHRLWSSFL